MLPGNVDVTVGYSYSESNGEFPWFQAQGLSTDLLGQFGIPGTGQIQNNLDIQESKLIAFFGRVNYNINDRYLAGLSVRRDGSSRFGRGNEWGTFPSVAVAWRVSEESFLSDISGPLGSEAPGRVGQDRQPGVFQLPAVHDVPGGRCTDPGPFGTEFVTTRAIVPVHRRRS